MNSLFCKNKLPYIHNVNFQNKTREAKGLLEAMDFFGVKSGIIITQKQKDVLKFDKQTIQPIPANQFMIEN